jgi:hypothetical protein
MSRHDYPLTPQTIDVLLHNCPKVAEAMHVEPQYVYGIVSGTNPDPFAYFIAAWDAAVAKGVDVSAWEARMAESKARVRQPGDLTKSLCEKMNGDGSTDVLVVNAMSDGQIDERECKPILRAIAIERDTLNLLETDVVHATVIDLRGHARKAAGGRTR